MLPFEKKKGKRKERKKNKEDNGYLFKMITMYLGS